MAETANYRSTPRAHPQCHDSIDAHRRLFPWQHLEEHCALEGRCRTYNVGPCRPGTSSSARCTAHRGRDTSELSVHASSAGDAQVGQHAELVAAIVGRGVVGARVATSHVSSVFVLYAGVGGVPYPKLLNTRGSGIGLEELLLDMLVGGDWLLHGTRRTKEKDQLLKGAQPSLLALLSR